MTSETIKSLLMIALFGVLEAALYLPRLRHSRNWMHLGHATGFHWPLAIPGLHAPMPVLVRRNLRKR